MASCVGGGVEVEPSFVVAVTHGNKPLDGVRVEVRGYGGENNDKDLFSGVTRPDGTIQIDLSPGEYWLNTELLGIGAGGGCFHINSNPSTKAEKRLEYAWGDLAPSTRQIVGRLIDIQPGEGAILLQNIRNGVVEPISGAKLTLQNPLTGDVYNTVSNYDGNFSFARSPDATYVLHVEGGKALSGRDYESTDILLRMSSSATQKILLLKRISAGGGSCGAQSFLVEFKANAPN